MPEGGADPAAGPPAIRTLPWYGFAAGILAIDQVTKRLAVAYLDYAGDVEVLPFLSWKLLHNPGAAFSMFASAAGWQRWVFSGVAVAVAVFVANELRKIRPGEAWYAFAYSCILAGALGNLVDRALLGYVIDFVFVHYGWFRFPVFNVADSAVSVGAATWIALMLLETLHARRR